MGASGVEAMEAVEAVETEARKQAAAMRAVDYVWSGMAVGLGTGSTARFVAEEIATRVRDGRLRDIVCIPTSERTRALAKELGIPFATLDGHPHLDLAIDGADEVAPNLDVIKGAGGALLREKIVAAAAARFIVVVDDSKLVSRLGEKAAVPIEVVRFGWQTHLSAIESLGGQPVLRTNADGQPFITDEGHFIVDARFDPMIDPYAVAEAIRRRPGVVETGLFLGMASIVVVGSAVDIDILTTEPASRQNQPL